MQQKTGSLKAVVEVQVPYLAAMQIQDRYLEDTSCRGCRQYYLEFLHTRLCGGHSNPHLRAPCTSPLICFEIGQKLLMAKSMTVDV